MQDPAISVAMCTYNGERYVQAQLDSVANQTRLPAELVVCDDCSSDDTVEVVSAFSAKAPFLVRLHRNRTNLGYAKNFQQTLRMCRGEFIALCDQDDVWYAKKLATLCDLLTADPQAGGIFSDGDLMREDGAPLNRGMWQTFGFTRRYQEQFRAGHFETLLMRKNVVTGMTLMIRAEMLPHILPIPSSWIHDAWMAWMICLRSKLIFCPERLVAYRVHGSQQIGTPPGFSQRLRRLLEVGLPVYLQSARTRNREEYGRVARQFEQFAAQLSDTNAPAHLVAKARKKVEYARRAESALLQPRSPRVARLTPHFLDYHHYSPRGLRALFVDLAT